MPCSFQKALVLCETDPSDHRLLIATFLRLTLVNLLVKPFDVEAISIFMRILFLIN